MSSLPDLYDLIEHINAQLTESTGFTPSNSLPKSIQEKLTKYILVEVGNLNLAIAIDDMSEVGPLPTITFLPNLPSWIQGIVSIRSEIISVIDFPGFLGEESGGGGGNRFVVLRHKKRKVGFRLDRIIGTVGRFKSDTKTLDESDKSLKNTAIFHFGLQVEKHFYYVLDVRKLLTAPRLIDYNRAD